MFKDKVLLITGGTGSFGNAVLNRFLHSEFAEIRIFSRDERKRAFQLLPGPAWPPEPSQQTLLHP